MPATVAATNGTKVATFQAEGAQIYEYTMGNDSNLSWVFREPIATLLLNDKTVGRHYAGPRLSESASASRKEVLRFQSAMLVLCGV